MEQQDYKPDSNLAHSQHKNKQSEQGKQTTSNKQLNTESRLDYDRKDFIKETLKTSIKLKIKLKKQATLISSHIELNEDEIISRLNKFIKN